MEQYSRTVKVDFDGGTAMAEQSKWNSDVKL